MRKLTILLMFFLFSVAQVWAQNRTVTGKVTDENGKAVAGASVTVTGSTKGAITKEDGTFTISVPSNAKTLTISGTSLENQKVAIPVSGNVLASVKTSSKDLEEVVVQVPYGTIKQSKFTGSEGTVTSKQIEKSPVTSISKVLEGLLPGVQTTNGGGAPGSGSSILVRGIGSAGLTSTNPLYVINGAMLDDATASYTVNALSPDEVESVTVLKDAAAAALYGSRSANGVIMITTKKGQKGVKAQIKVRATQGFLSRGIPEYDRLNQKQYYEMMWEGTKNSLYATGQTSGNPITMAQAGQNASQQLTDGNHLVYNAYNVPGSQLVDPVTGKLNSNAKLLWNESWEKALFQTAQRQNVGVTISGANDKSDYLLSFGFLNEDGTMKYTGYKRYNARISVNTVANDWLSAGFNVDGSFANDKTVANGGSATSNPFYFTRQMGPIYPVYQHDLTTGAILLDPVTGQPIPDLGIASQMGTRPYASNSNLVLTLPLDDNNSKKLNANANTYLEAKFLKHFALRTSFGINFFNDYLTRYQNSLYGDASNVSGRNTKTTIMQTSFTMNEVLSWNNSYGKHSVRALVGHENYKYQQDYSQASGIGFAFVNLYELANASTAEQPYSAIDNHTIESYFTGANYDYDRKYLLSASIRSDANSRFRSDIRKHSFYSVGAGWVLSEETFLKKTSWINLMKLKASYGEQGNEAVRNIDGSPNYYVYQNLYSLSFANVGAPGSFPNGKSPSPATWETSKNLNFGVEFTLFNKRLQGSVEYFDRRSDGLLFDIRLPLSTGVSSILKNVGTMKNVGYELQLGYNAIRHKNFDWRIDFNITTYKNTITKLPDEYPNGVISASDGTKKFVVGHGARDFYLREFAGVDAATGDALYYKGGVDQSGKMTGARTVTTDFTQASQYFVGGSSIPKFSGGLTNSFKYKNIELSFLLTYSYGAKFYDGNYAGLMHNGDYGIAWHTDILNRWQKPGDLTNVPRVQNGLSANGSSRYLFDGSYLNIRNVTLGYNLPKASLKKLNLSGFQIFSNIDNVWLFTAKKGANPQNNFNGTNDATYPPFRTVVFGVNVNF